MLELQVRENQRTSSICRQKKILKAKYVIFKLQPVKFYFKDTTFKCKSNACHSLYLLNLGNNEACRMFCYSIVCKL